MTAPHPLHLSDETRGISLTVHGGDAARLELAFRAPADRLELRASAALDAAVVPSVAADEAEALRLAQLTRRAGLALPFVTRALRQSIDWLFASREDTNYTYELTPQNLRHLAHLLAVATGRPAAELTRYIAEPAADAELQAHIAGHIDRLPPALRAVADRTARFGRRLGWYALTRALKPRLVIETGVDKGLGGVLLCAALRRNATEGHAGRYLGTDIRPTAGYLVSGPYAAMGRVAYGDSIATLGTLREPVDLFINDSDHAAEYEAREYRVVAPLLSAQAVVVGDNAHVTDALAAFAEETGRRFLFFKEQPAGHFYPGAGIGLAFR
jgi:predicted O-methyltransferase YrrM